ncbi:MAG: hypothetical protein V4478_02030 [Patescibacteria group bacterium]
MRKIIGKLTLITILTSCLVIGFFGLIAFNIKDMLFGSPLKIKMVADGTTVDTAYLPISGTAKNARQISINSRIVSIDRSGNFNDGVILSPGYNIVEVAERDQFGKEKKETIRVVSVPPPTVAQNTTSPYQR